MDFNPSCAIKIVNLCRQSLSSYLRRFASPVAIARVSFLEMTNKTHKNQWINKNRQSKLPIFVEFLAGISPYVEMTKKSHIQNSQL